MHNLIKQIFSAGHPSYLKFTNSCGIFCCRELGNAIHDLPFHYTLPECPFEINNWNAQKNDNRLAEHYEQTRL